VRPNPNSKKKLSAAFLLFTSLTRPLTNYLLNKIQISYRRKNQLKGKTFDSAYGCQEDRETGKDNMKEEQINNSK
jgi:hypothetical protein